MIAFSQNTITLQSWQGSQPAPRFNFPMAAINDTIYVFSGVLRIMNPIGALRLARGVSWGVARNYHIYFYWWPKFIDRNIRAARFIPWATLRFFSCADEFNGDFHKIDTVKIWQAPKSNVDLVCKASIQIMLTSYWHQASLEWTLVNNYASPSFPQTRCCAGMTEANGRIYLFGGKNAQGLYLQSFLHSGKRAKIMTFLAIFFRATLKSTLWIQPVDRTLERTVS